MARQRERYKVIEVYQFASLYNKQKDKSLGFAISEGVTWNNTTTWSDRFSTREEAQKFLDDFIRRRRK